VDHSRRCGRGRCSGSGRRSGSRLSGDTHTLRSSSFCLVCFRARKEQLKIFLSRSSGDTHTLRSNSFCQVPYNTFIGRDCEKSLWDLSPDSPSHSGHGGRALVRPAIHTLRSNSFCQVRNEQLESERNNLKDCARKEQLKRFQGSLPESQGHDCLICAEFARQRPLPHMPLPPHGYEGTLGGCASNHRFVYLLLLLLYSRYRSYKVLEPYAE